MNGPRKPTVRADGTMPEMSKLKALDPSTRAGLYALTDAMSGEAWRALVLEKHGIDLRSDTCVTDFRTWQFRQVVWDRLNDQAVQDEANLAAGAASGVSRDQLRAAAIMRAYAQADLLGDPKLALQVVDRDLKEQLDGQKLELARQEHALARERFERETCELFLKWRDDQRAAEIAASPTTNAEKIAALQALMFGAPEAPAESQPSEAM